MNINNYAPMNGRLISEDGKIVNIVDLLGGGETVSDKNYNIDSYAPRSGRVLGEDGKVYNLVNLLGNYTELLAEFAVEEKNVNLTNTEKYPFNDSVYSVSMAKARKTKNYIVETEVINSDGNVGEIVISDKTLNGFKAAFTGSAKNVLVAIKIRGGILA